MPVFVYALNGTLYLDAKVLIPFMPLCLLLVGRLLVKIKEDKFFRPSSFSFILSSFFTAIVIALFMMTAPRKAFVSGFLAVDVVIALIVLALYFFVKKKAVITAGAVAAAVIAGISVNLTDGLSEASKLDKFFSDDMYSLTDEISRDEDVVRTGNLISRDDTPNYIYNDDYHVCTIYSSLHNKKYNTFYFETIHNENEYRNSALTTQSQSFLFQTYMGEKYLISDKKTKPSVNYQKIKQAGELSLYKCESVRPLGYCCSELLNEKAFEDIEYPYSLSALMNNIIRMLFHRLGIEQTGNAGWEAGTFFPAFLLATVMKPAAASLCLFMVGWITVFKPLFWVFSFSIAYGMRAAGDVRFSMITSSCTMWLCRVLLTTILIRVLRFGPIAVWIGMFSDWGVRGIIFSHRFVSGKWLSHALIGQGETREKSG